MILVTNTLEEKFIVITMILRVRKQDVNFIRVEIIVINLNHSFVSISHT